MRDQVPELNILFPADSADKKADCAEWARTRRLPFLISQGIHLPFEIKGGAFEARNKKQETRNKKQETRNSIPETET